VCDAGKCSPVSPDPIPDDCVAPFPGHPHSNCSASMDLMLLLDGSASIDSGSWNKILQFTANIGLNFTTGHDFMRYGVVQFSSVAQTYMPLEANNATFQQTMQLMQQMTASTNTSGGVAQVEQEFKRNGRPGAFKALVILTDGMWNTGGSPLDITTRMKKEGIRIFTVAVGNANNANVEALSSTPLSKYFYNVTNEDMLPLILHKMIWNMCVRDPAHDGAFPALLESDVVQGGAVLPQAVSQTEATPQDDPAPAPWASGADSASPVAMSSSEARDSDVGRGTAASGPFDCGATAGGRWITFVNQGLNPLRINLCSLDFNKEVCKGGPAGANDTYTTCDATGNNKGPDALTFIPANSTVALRLDLNVTYIVAIFCVDNPQSVHCLSTPTPLEFYGPTPEGGKPWPSVLAVPVAAAPYCNNDRDCPAPYHSCNAQGQCSDSGFSTQ